MSKTKLVVFCLITAVLAGTALPVFAQLSGAGSISSGDLKKHLTFIASDEIRGRNTPSPELKIVARYLASRVESYGFKPLMPDGTFFQRLDVISVRVSEESTKMTVSKSSDDLAAVISYNFPKAFSATPGSNGSFSGEVVFVGFGLSAPDYDWDDYKDVDVTGKVVVMLNGSLPTDHELNIRSNRRILRSRGNTALRNGAVAVLTVVNPQTDERMKSSGEGFPVNSRTLYGAPPAGQSSSFSGSITHEVAMFLLGVNKSELEGMFEKINKGEQVTGKEFPGVTVDIAAESSSEVTDYTRNVVALLEGTDPVLKEEYVLFGAHYDHTGVRANGEINNGADDDGSGTVALLEIAQAMSIERPKRSVVIVWHTGEEKGLRGARYFTENPPIPLENISAQINMDMVGRNDPNTLFVIGAGRISTDLDSIVIEKNSMYANMNLDYKFDAPDDPNSFYTRSDHYMYAQYGIPIVFFFTDVHEDYHRPTDTVDKINFTKIERIAKLAYHIGFEVANRPAMLPLNADPRITKRGILYPPPPRGGR